MKSCRNCKYYDGLCCMYDCRAEAILNGEESAKNCQHFSAGEYDPYELEKAITNDFFCRACALPGPQEKIPGARGRRRSFSWQSRDDFRQPKKSRLSGIERSSAMAYNICEVISMGGVMPGIENIIESWSREEQMRALKYLLKKYGFVNTAPAMPYDDLDDEEVDAYYEGLLQAD